MNARSIPTSRFGNDCRLSANIVSRWLCFSHLVLVFVLLPLTVDAEEYVITANRIPTEATRVGSAYTVITGEELIQKQQRTVLDALRSVPGVDVVRSGGKGGNASVFLRGANAEHTLVLIDGVEVNDPSSPTRAFNFANLTADNIDRIEILRGSQSTVYGSDAIGGVIQIFTRKGKGDPSLDVAGEGGAYESFTGSVNAGAGFERGDASVGFSYHDTDGISAASSRDGNSERDGYDNATVSGRFGMIASEVLRFNFVGRVSNSNAELDNLGGVAGDDPNRELETEEVSGRGEAVLELFDGALKQIYSASFSQTDREDNNDPDLDHPGEILRSDFKGQQIKFELQNTLEAGEDNTIVFGASWEEEEAKSNFFSDGSFGPFESNFPREDAHTTGVYLQDQLDVGASFFVTGGVRVDDHSEFGSEFTWRVAPVVHLEESGTRIKGSAGTGFKAPSLFQLFSSFGSKDLNPEESLSFDAGVEQEFFDGVLTAGVTFFYSEIDELITLDPATFLFENISKAESQGIEASLGATPFDYLRIALDLTFLDTEDKDTGEDLLRRADFKANANLFVDLSDELTFNLAVVHIGVRDDNDFSTATPTRVTLSAYTLVNLAASYAIAENIEIFGRVENLFDEEYEEVVGFGVPGIAGYGGVRVRL